MDLDRTETGPNGYLNCYQKMKPIFDFITKSNDIKTVFLAFHHDEYFFPNAKLTDQTGILNNEKGDDLLTASLIKTIQTLNSSGKEVVLIYDLPNLAINTGTHIKKCFYSKLLKIDAGCKPEDIEFHDDFKRYDAIIERLQKETSIKVFDTRPYISGNFPINENNEWTYRDYQHLTLQGSMFLSDKYKWQKNYAI